MGVALVNQSVPELDADADADGAASSERLVAGAAAFYSLPGFPFASGSARRLCSS